MPVAFPYFGGQPHEHFQSTSHDDVLLRHLPVKKLKGVDGPLVVASVFDLFLGNYGVDRGLGGPNVARSFDDDVPYTPAWQERITGVKRADVITVARQFAENADKTRGKSMVIIGAAMNHWYHMDMNYRGVINLLVMCGCVGQSGGGWSHYVGQEKLRPQTGWTALAFALDWNRPPRQHELHVVLVRAHGPVALREAVGARDPLAARQSEGSTPERSSTSTCAPSAWAGCRPPRSCRRTRSRSCGRRPPRAWSRSTMR